MLVAATGASSANFANATLTGGSGANQFVFSSGAQYATNTVTNFDAAKGDTIVLVNLVPVTVTNPFAGYLQIQTSNGNSTLLYDATGEGANYVTLGTFSGTTLTSSNIVVAQSSTVPTVTSVATRTRPAILARARQLH